MPHRHYIARKHPPSVDDQILAHPYVLVFSIMSLALGLWIIGGTFLPYTVSNVLERGEPLVRALSASPAVVGGLITLGGLARSQPQDRYISMMTECAGVIIMASAWTCYGLLLTAHAGSLGSIPPWGVISLFLAVSHGLHGLSLILSLRRIGRAEKDIERERTGQRG